MGQMRNIYKISVRKPDGKRPLGRARIHGKIILEWVFGKYAGNLCSGFIWLRISISGGLLWKNCAP
jgi:hypothetical protein